MLQGAAVNYLVIAALAYVIGALPIAYGVVRLLSGKDLRTLGSGNVGVMNTVRQAGLPAGMLVFLGEGAKAVAAIGVARSLSGAPLGDTIAVLMATVGVNWSVFLRFAGGRGTTIAVFSALTLLWPLVVVLGLLWLVVYRLTRDNFIATRVNIIVTPFATAALVWLMGKSWLYVTLALGGSLVTLIRHRRATDDHALAAAEHARTTAV